FSSEGIEEANGHGLRRELLAHRGVEELWLLNLPIVTRPAGGVQGSTTPARVPERFPGRKRRSGTASNTLNFSVLNFGSTSATRWRTIRRRRWRNGLTQGSVRPWSPMSQINQEAGTDRDADFEQWKACLKGLRRRRR